MARQTKKTISMVNGAHILIAATLLLVLMIVAIIIYMDHGHVVIPVGFDPNLPI